MLSIQQEISRAVHHSMMSRRNSPDLLRKWDISDITSVSKLDLNQYGAKLLSINDKASRHSHYKTQHATSQSGVSRIG